MSESATPRRILHLVVEGFPTEGLEEIAKAAPGTNDIFEIYPLTEANAREALEKIFEANTVAVWGDLSV